MLFPYTLQPTKDFQPLCSTHSIETKTWLQIDLLSYGNCLMLFHPPCEVGLSQVLLSQVLSDISLCGLQKKTNNNNFPAVIWSKCTWFSNSHFPKCNITLISTIKLQYSALSNHWSATISNTWKNLLGKKWRKRDRLQHYYLKPVNIYHNGNKYLNTLGHILYIFDSTKLRTALIFLKELIIWVIFTVWKQNNFNLQFPCPSPRLFPYCHGPQALVCSREFVTPFPQSWSSLELDQFSLILGVILSPLSAQGN